MFFFKQKTAYEMRISDWSSDVCSSDLVQITQTYDVEYGWNLIGRYAGLYVSRHVGDDMKLGLSRLSNMLASVPNIDYAVEGSGMRGLSIMERPAEDLLVVKAGSIERDNEAIKTSMKSNMEWIKRTMAANDLVAAGPMRILSTELGRETSTFDIAQPVRKAGSGEDGDAAARDEDEKAASADEQDGDEPTFVVDTQAPVVAAGEPLVVEIPDGAPVEYVQPESGRVAMTYFSGLDRKSTRLNSRH